MAATCEFLDFSGVMAIAHQGGAGERAGNTMAAFQHAADLRYTYSETDVCATADGQLYTYHGTRKERPPKEPIDPAVVEDAPLLTDVLEEFPQMRFFLDPKHEPAVKALAGVVARTNSVGRVSIGAFSGGRTLATAREIYELTGQEVCTAMSLRAVASLALRGRVRPGPLTLQVPPWDFLLRPSVVKAAHAAEPPISVIAWGADNKAVMEALLDKGVDGLMTDHPTVLKSLLYARGLWRQL